MGLDPLDEPGTAKLMEELFAEELQGHKLIINRSMWRNFPAIRCDRWVYENCVILGDAKATAHFSIGSGTKLAMEDAIGLYEFVPQDGRPECEGGARAITRPPAARRSRRPSIPPTCRWCGSNT